MVMIGIEVHRRHLFCVVALLNNVQILRLAVVVSIIYQ